MYSVYRPTCALNGTAVQCFPHFHIRTPTESENVWQHTEEDELGCLQPEQWAKVLATPGPAPPEDERSNISARQTGISALLTLHFFLKRPRNIESRDPNDLGYFTSPLIYKWRETAVFLSFPASEGQVSIK